MMLRLYLAFAILSVAAFSYGQYKGHPLFVLGASASSGRAPGGGVGPMGSTIYHK